AALTLLIGTISTPVICQKIFAQGYALTGETGNPGALGQKATSELQRADSLRKMLSEGSTGAGGRGSAMPPPLSAPATPGL
ncbi:hypothetical protein, partial [Termitidicoccus mucosus]